MAKPRDYQIACKDCVVEFDGGTIDGPKAYVIFCPIHEAAVEMKIILESLLDSRILDGMPVTQQMIARIVKNSPSAPVGAPSGSPVAAGANLQEEAAKQT